MREKVHCNVNILYAAAIQCEKSLRLFLNCIYTRYHEEIHSVNYENSNEKDVFVAQNEKPYFFSVKREKIINKNNIKDGGAYNLELEKKKIFHLKKEENITISV